jgi:hypothetical protein
MATTPPPLQFFATRPPGEVDALVAQPPPRLDRAGVGFRRGDVGTIVLAELGTLFDAVPAAATEDAPPGNPSAPVPIPSKGVAY